MQRRLTIALLATALASILLVGFGVLAMAQISAISNAENRVRDRLPVLTSAPAVQDQIGRNDRGRRALRQAFGFQRIEPIQVEANGRVTIGNGRRRAPAASIDLTLRDDEITAYLDHETVLISNRSAVLAVRRLADNDANTSNGTPGILVQAPVTTVTRQAVVWFLLSSLMVLAGAAAAGLWLARRLTKPIQQIKQTTSAIANGDLDARASVEGNDEVADLANEVNQMAVDLKRSRALDRQFLMSISHDLKTPITAIAGYGEALSDGAIDDPKRVGNVIQNQAQRLDRLVGDLLDLARLDANRFALNSTTFNAATVVGRTATGLNPKASSADIALVVDGKTEAQTLGDPDRTEQAVGNLIDNALRFARRRVTISVGQDEAWTTIAVSDDGPGISPEDQNYIFDRLYTGKAQPSQSENSTGLGLAIVKELANAMGGDTKATVSESGGAKLMMRLPRAENGSD